MATIMKRKHAGYKVITPAGLVVSFGKLEDAEQFCLKYGFTYTIKWWTMYLIGLFEYQQMTKDERTAFLGAEMFIAFVGYGNNIRYPQRVRLLANGFDVINPTDGCIYRTGQWEAF